MDVHFLGWSASSHVWPYSAISEKIRNEVETKTSILATKEDLACTRHILDKWKADIIKCLFIYTVAQMITTFGLLLLFLK